MSIKGIDNQIMITRAAELVRETSAQLKKTELMQDYLNVQSLELEKQKKHIVQKTPEIAHVEQIKDKQREGGSREAAHQGKGQDGKSREEESDALQIAAEPETHHIDIKI
jgi:uncharacterized protein (DUF3084 family)